MSLCNTGRETPDASHAFTVIIGADIARQCIQETLIDEIRVHLAPILLGNGVRFFQLAPRASRDPPGTNRLHPIQPGDQSPLPRPQVKRLATDH